MVWVLRPHGAPAEWRRSGCGWRVEAIHELDEHVLEAGLVVVGVLPDERDHLAIAVGSLTVVATGLIDHAEAIVAVVHVGEPHQEIAGSLLGLVELAGTDEFGGGVGRDGQFVLVSVLGAGEPRRNGGSHLTKVQAMRDGAFDAPRFGLGQLLARDRLLLGKATLLILVAAAAGAGIIASGLGHCGQHLRAEEDAPLYRDLLADAKFHELLLAYDRDLADTARCAGCARCSGVVHSAPYWRKPRGRPCRLGGEHDRRFSFCCAVDGCRSRATPPSLRFLGPKVYIAAIVVLIAILRHGATARRMRELTELIGVDRRTVERWRTWWRDSFTTTSFWQIARATFMPQVDQNRLPAALIERFTGDDADRLVALLRLIAPITGGNRHAG